MKWFRIFFKEYDEGVEDSTNTGIEIECKNITAALEKAKKMGRKKKKRVVMVAEVAKSGTFPENL